MPEPESQEPATNTPAALTRGGLLARNALWIVLAQLTPVVVALFAIPRLIHGLGTDRFGLLALCWIVTANFGVFDLGIGRALTQLVAHRLGSGRDDQVPALVWTSLAMILALSVVGGLTLALAAPWLVQRALRIAPALQPEGLVAFRLLAAGVPLVLVTASFAGVLAAYQRFAATVAVRIPQSVFSYLAPLAVLPFSRRVSAIVAVLLTGWAASLVAHVLICMHAVPALRARPIVDRAQVPTLMGFGGWMTVSNVIAPFFVSVDRFLIGAWVSMSAVAFYATPYEMATRMWVVATPLASVLFPAFAVSHAYDQERMERLFFRGVKYVLITLFPAVLIMVTLAHEGLALWLGEEFARKSTDVLQLIAVGVFVNSLAQIAFALLQGAGRPRLTALLHLVELPLYLSVAWWLIHADGIRGAATAWAARMTFDAVCLFLLTLRLLHFPRALISRLLLPAVAAAAAFGGAFALQHFGLPVRFGYLVVVLAAFAVLAWTRGLRSERDILLGNRTARGLGAR